jgi:dimethylaniline monooxygenase (N-oxide forming)
MGGLWNFKQDETEFSTVMKSTVINTSKEMTGKCSVMDLFIYFVLAYTDLAPAADDANYMHNTSKS